MLEQNETKFYYSAQLIAQCTKQKNAILLKFTRYLIPLSTAWSFDHV